MCHCDCTCYAVVAQAAGVVEAAVVAQPAAVVRTAVVVQAGVVGVDLIVHEGRGLVCNCR